MRERVFIDSVTIYRNKWEREGVFIDSVTIYRNKWEREGVFKYFTSIYRNNKLTVIFKKSTGATREGPS